MKVMVIVKATRNSEAGVMPDEQLIAQMMKFNEELVQASILVSGDGLRPSSKGLRVHFHGDERRVVPGPFQPTEELVAGFWIWQVQSMDEALQWAKRCPFPMPGEEAILEIRPFVEPEDFGEAFTPELQEQERKLREAVK